MAELQACQHCAGTIQDPRQRTCPHCLEELRTRSFRSREDLERFREDRRAHGASVVHDGEDGGRPVLGLVLGLAGTIMVLAGGVVAYGGIVSGDIGRAANTIGQAVVPLAMGLGLFVMARRYGGSGG